MRYTILVGPPHRARELLREKGLAPDCQHVASVHTLKGLKGTLAAHPGARILFLRGWRDLAEWRQIYNHVQTGAGYRADQEAIQERIDRQWRIDMAAMDLAARTRDRRRSP